MKSLNEGVRDCTMIAGMKGPSPGFLILGVSWIVGEEKKGIADLLCARHLYILYSFVLHFYLKGSYFTPMLQSLRRFGDFLGIIVIVDKAGFCHLPEARCFHFLAKWLAAE